MMNEKLKQLLIKNGVEEEKAKEILSKLQKEKIYFSSEENLDVRYGKLKEQQETGGQALAAAEARIKELEEGQGKIEPLQAELTELKANNETLSAENSQLKLENALKVKLLTERARPESIDYLLFKIRSESEDVSIDEEGKLSGIDVERLKTTYPLNFESAEKPIIEGVPLPKLDEPNKTISKTEFNSMGYKERLKLSKDDPALYEELRD
ncbi:MAG: phage scaffolding protein [Anaerovoracaceae bacterium]